MSGARWLGLLLLAGGVSSASAVPPVPAPAPPGEPLPRVWVWLVSEASGEGPAVAVEALALPPRSEVYLRPRWALIDGQVAPPLDSRGLVRLQVVARLIRADGGVSQWMVGAGRQAAPGEGGRNLELAAEGPTLVDLGPARHGPVLTGMAAALELSVALVRSPAVQTARVVGAAALARAPGPGAAPEAERAAAAAAIRRAGGWPVLAVRLPVVELGDPRPGGLSYRLVVATRGAGPELSASAVAAVRNPTEQVPSPLRGRDGEPLSGVTAVVFDVEIEVPDHREPAAPGDQAP